MKALKQCYFSLVYLFLYLPIILLIVFSFNHSKYSALWHGFSWQWYRMLWQDAPLLSAAKHSLLLAIVAATFAMMLGTLAAMTLFRFRFFGRRWLQAVLFIMILLPDLILGVSLLLLYTLWHIPLGFFSLLIAHITFCLPFVITTTYSRLVGVDKHIVDAAKDLGASDWRVLFTVLIPMMLPTIAASWLISFTLSIDDIVISYFVSGPSFQILPIALYSSIRVGITPELNALCTLMFLVTVVTVILAGLLLRKRKLIETLT